jgi:hypothetical protein
MRSPARVALAVLLLLAISNLLASVLLGLGDAEALYACYGRHLQLAYLDHPPLIGWLTAAVTTLLGQSVLAVRVVSLLLTPLTLWLAFVLARDLYGSRAAGWTSLLLLATPMFAIGTIAVTPDSPLMVLWLAFVWQLQRALKETDRVGAWPRFGRPVLLGLLLGAAFLSKYTGVCLVVTALLVVFGRNGRVWLGRPGFWIGALVAAVVASPVICWNAAHDWAGLLHRLEWTQDGAGFSLRNVGALIGGQLLYAGPLTLILFFWSAKRIWRARRDDPGPVVLLAASIPALVATYLLVLWSDVAEPHWPAPGYLPLVIGAAGMVAEGKAWPRRLARCAVGLGAFVLLAAHVLVLSPLLPTVSGDSYRPEYDLGNELRGWPELAETVRALDRDGRPVLAAFYTQCSQLELALAEEGDPAVRCVSPERDDFDIWYGDFELDERGALFVTDNRFEHDPLALVPGSATRGPPIVFEIERAGRWVRRFSIYELEPGSGSRAE